MHHRITTLAWLGLAACGQSERTFSGELDLASLARSEATLVATRDGARVESSIRSDGGFTVALPEGRWAIAFAETKDDRRVFANLVTGEGTTRSKTVLVKDGAAFDMGVVRPLDDRQSSNQPDTLVGCREVDPTSGGISTFSSFLVRAEAEPDTADDNGVDPADTDEDDRPDELDEDDDGDGICDDDQPDDGDEPDGGDEDDGDEDEPDGEADLPYDARLEIGDTFTLAQAFAEKGPQPAAILSVEMDGGSWRLAELESGTAFTVDQTDCDHEGNRDQGRDRIFVSWRNADGSVDVDHLDLRYCDR